MFKFSVTTGIWVSVFLFCVFSVIIAASRSLWKNHMRKMPFFRQWVVKNDVVSEPVLEQKYPEVDLERSPTKVNGAFSAESDGLDDSVLKI